MTDRRELNACYSSSHPDVLAAWDELQANYRAYRDKVDRFVEDYGLSGRQLYEFRTIRGGVRLAGVGWPRPSEHWRADRDAWVPYKSKQKGDPELWRRFSELAFTYPGLPGMPDDVMSGFGISSPSWNVFGGVMWVCWTQPHERVEADLTIWTLNKPSQYYAAKEAAQEEG